MSYVRRETHVYASDRHPNHQRGDAKDGGVYLVRRTKMQTVTSNGRNVLREDIVDDVLGVVTLDEMPNLMRTMAVAIADAAVAAAVQPEPKRAP